MQRSTTQTHSSFNQYRVRTHKTISHRAAAAPGPEVHRECPMTLYFHICPSSQQILATPLIKSGKWVRNLTLKIALLVLLWCYRSMYGTVGLWERLFRHGGSLFFIDFAEIEGVAQETCSWGLELPKPRSWRHSQWSICWSSHSASWLCPFSLFPFSISDFHDLQSLLQDKLVTRGRGQLVSVNVECAYPTPFPEIIGLISGFVLCICLKIKILITFVIFNYIFDGLEHLVAYWH